MVACDDTGLVISMTTTILLCWGSRIMDPSTGIILNNGMEDFSHFGQSNTWGYGDTPANYVQGGKRPLSSQSPYIIEEEGEGWVFAGGCAGGSRIISCNVQQARNRMVS
jgi:gamma-glutamyltranspeptidase/glutathione hydrolase